MYGRWSHWDSTHIGITRLVCRKYRCGDQGLGSPRENSSQNAGGSAAKGKWNDMSAYRCELPFGSHINQQQAIPLLMASLKMNNCWLHTWHVHDLLHDSKKQSTCFLLCTDSRPTMSTEQGNIVTDSLIPCFPSLSCLSRSLNQLHFQACQSSVGWTQPSDMSKCPFSELSLCVFQITCSLSRSPWVLRSNLKTSDITVFDLSSAQISWQDSTYLVLFFHLLIWDKFSSSTLLIVNVMLCVMGLWILIL